MDEISVLIASANSEGSGESAHAQTGQNLHCSHAQTKDVDEGSRPKFRLQALLDTSARAFIRGIYAYAISTKILCPGPLLLNLYEYTNAVTDIDIDMKRQLNSVCYCLGNKIPFLP